MQPQSKYLKPSLPALHYALNTYLIIILGQAFPFFSKGETATRFDNLLTVAIALGMTGLLL